MMDRGETEVAIQRDFIGVDQVSDNVVIILDEEQNDGFYNAMRWLLPRKMLSLGKLILHSSNITLLGICMLYLIITCFLITGERYWDKIISQFFSLNAHNIS